MFLTILCNSNILKEFEIRASEFITLDLFQKWSNKLLKNGSSLKNWPYIFCWLWSWDNMLGPIFLITWFKIKIFFSIFLININHKRKLFWTLLSKILLHLKYYLYYSPFEWVPEHLSRFLTDPTIATLLEHPGQ